MKKLTIAINTRLLLPHRMEGIARFIHETTKRMVAEHPEHDFHFLFDRAYDEQYIYGDNVTPHVVYPPSRHPILWYIWFEHAVPRLLKKIKADVFLSGDMYISLASKVPSIMVSHDLNYVHKPEYITWSSRKYLGYYSRKYHEQADHLIAVSEATKQDIISTYNIEASKISIAYNDVPGGFVPMDNTAITSIRNRWTDEQPYFLYVGSLRPRKNIPALLEAFDIYKEKTSLPDKLVIYGRAAYKTQQITDIMEDMSFSSDVIFLNDSNLTVPEITGAARALCFVSLYEGFGIPILEAMHCDIPIITSTTSSMPEVAGDAALLVNPTDINEIAAAMERISTDNLLVQKLVENGKKQRQKFSWDKSADNIYEQIVKLAT